MGSEISPIWLSTGTIKFISLFSFIIKGITNEAPALFIDEIDTYLYVSLVEFFKSLIKATNTNTQLIFTSHNYECLTNSLSHKQIFYIDEEDGKKEIIKVSSAINNNNSAASSFIKKRIGSHPSTFDIDNCFAFLLEKMVK